MKRNRKFIKLALVLALAASAMGFYACDGNGETEQTQLCISEDIIQPWLCEDWTVQTWIAHLNKLKSAGYSTIILQSSADVKDGVLSKTYFIDRSIDCEQVPTVERMVSACESVGFSARIGLLNDDEWWGEIDDEKVGVWNAIGATVTKSIYEKLVDSSVFAGFYWTFEFYTQDKGYETYWAKLMNSQIETLNGLSTEVPILFSPYYSAYYALSKSECLDMWTRFFDLCEFRDIDVFAPQDGYGGGKPNATATDDCRVRSHLESASAACAEHSRARFYVNVEMFTDVDGVYATETRIEHQKAIAASYKALGLISFSYSHYFCK